MVILFAFANLSLSDIEGNARPSGREEYEQGLCVEWGLNPHPHPAHKKFLNPCYRRRSLDETCFDISPLPESGKMRATRRIR